MILRSSIRTKMKNGLRKLFKDKNNNHLFICDDIISFLDNIEFKSICLYSNIDNELNIDKLFNYLKDKDIDIIYPFMKKDNNKMIITFKKYDNEFIDDDYHIKSVNGKDVNINDCDIILIPGLAYNVYGYRLGRGKGFYDKALKEYQGIKIGVVCDDNIIDEHFEEAHDVKVDYLVSEKRIIKI